MSVYSFQFVGLHNFEGTHVYTVPDGFTAIVQCINIFQGSGLGAQECSISGNAGQTFARTSNALLSDNLFGWVGKHVLTAGQTLTVECSSGGSDVSVGGALLLGINPYLE